MKLFGSDGIRGRANEFPITAEVALRTGKAVASVLRSNGPNRNRVLLGKDTRISGYMLETALTSGLVSMGMDVFMVGPMPTPAVAHLTKSMGAAAGIMITASHNPYEDNGMKIFGPDGYKLSDELEDLIERHILGEVAELPPLPVRQIGKAHRIDDARGRYIEYVKHTADNVPLHGIQLETCSVGDRNVSECMRKHGSSFGGENSGHLVFAEHTTTGDGILSALQVLRMMHDQNATLAQLAAVLTEYPAQLANIPVASKPPLDTVHKLIQLMSQADAAFGVNGRHLIRYSGTENKIRVLVEHREIDECRMWVSKFAAVIRDEIG